MQFESASHIMLSTTCLITHHFILSYYCVTEIFRDIAARMESSHHWRNAKENFANDIPSFQQEDSAEVEEEEEEEEEEESEEEESLSVSSDEEDTGDYEDGSTSPSLPLLPVLKKGKDVILSMRDANYKATMFSFFQKLGAKTSVQRDPDEEKKVKEEAYDFFKNSGGRLMIYRTKSVADGLMKADDKAAWSSKCFGLIYWYVFNHPFA